MSLPPDRPDWRDASAYAPLLDVERSGHAWEWLRRDPHYRSAAGRHAAAAGQYSGGSATPQAQGWGLEAFENPALPAIAARPIWSRAAHDLVLSGLTVPARSNGHADTAGLDRIASRAILIAAPGGEHVLLSNGRRSIRIDLKGAGLTSGPVRVVWQIEGLNGASAPVLVLRRLLAFVESGGFSCRLHPREARARRLVLLLRSSDALATGATQRDIAATLLGAAVGEPRWRVDASSMRSQAQRLVRGAADMAKGGWLRLLR